MYCYVNVFLINNAQSNKITYLMCYFPVYKLMDDAMKNHADADVLVSFASLRSAYDSTMEAMEYSQVKLVYNTIENVSVDEKNYSICSV